MPAGSLSGAPHPLGWTSASAYVIRSGPSVRICKSPAESPIVDHRDVRIAITELRQAHASHLRRLALLLRSAADRCKQPYQVLAVEAACGDRAGPARRPSSSPAGSPRFPSACSRPPRTQRTLKRPPLGDARVRGRLPAGGPAPLEDSQDKQRLRATKTRKKFHSFGVFKRCGRTFRERISPECRRLNL